MWSATPLSGGSASPHGCVGGTMTHVCLIIPTGRRRAGDRARRAQDGPRPGARPPAPAAAALQPDRAQRVPARGLRRRVPAERLRHQDVRHRRGGHGRAGAGQPRPRLRQRPGLVALHRAVLPPRNHAARLRRAPAPPADPAARLHQRRAPQLPLRARSTDPSQPRGVGVGGEPPAASHVQGADPRPGPGDLRGCRPEPRGAARR